MLGSFSFLGRPRPRLGRVSVSPFGGARAGTSLVLVRPVSREVGWSAGAAAGAVAFSAALPLGLLFRAVCDGRGSTGRFMPAILALRRGGGGRGWSSSWYWAL